MTAASKVQQRQTERVEYMNTVQGKED